MRSGLLALSISLLSLILIGAPPVGVEAQTTWTCFIDFGRDIYWFEGWNDTSYFTMGHERDSEGWHSSTLANNRFTGVVLISALLRGDFNNVTATYMQLNLEYEHGTDANPDFDKNTIYLDTHKVWEQGVGYVVPEPITASGSWSFNQFYITIYSSDLAWTDLEGDNGSVTLNSIYFEGTGAYAPDEELCGEPEALEASFDATPLSGPAPLEVDFNNTTTGASGAAVYNWNFGDGNTVAATNAVKIYEVPGTYTATLTVTDGSEMDTYSQVIEVEQGEFYKPLTPADSDTNLLYPPDQAGLFDFAYAEEAAEAYGGFGLGLIDMALTIQKLRDAYERATGGVGWNDSTPDPGDSARYNVTAVSNTPDRPIHAIAGGTVMSVETLSDCDGIRCIFVIPESLTGGVHNIVLRAEMAGAAVVRVAVGDREVRYIVRNAQVSVGDEIEAGCIIGYTMVAARLNNWELETLSIAASLQFGENGEMSGGVSAGAEFKVVTRLVPFGVAFIKLVEGETPLPLLEELTNDPTSLTPCNVDPAHATCQGDVSLSDPTLWTKTGGVLWDAGSKPTLTGGAAITEQLALSPSASYKMSVQARRGSGTGATSITLQIGGTIQTFPMVAQYATYTIDAAMHEADVGLYYSISVLNSGAVPFELLGVCVSEDGAGTAEPNVCVFQNPSLDDDGATWSLSSGVGSGFNSGELVMSDGDTIAQTIRLYPNGAGAYEYVVQVRASVFGDMWESETASEVGFSYSYGGGGFIPFSAPNGAIDGIDFALFETAPPYTATRRAGNELVFEAVIEVAAPIEEPFIIRADITLAGGFSGGVMIREACVTNPFAESDIGAGGGLPFPTNCNAVAAPSDERLSSWTYFLWSSMDRFFQCDLMELLNKIYGVAYSGLTLARWQIQYWQAYLTYVGQWLGNTLIPWFNGHFANMARANGVTVVQSGESGGAGFWDVLLAIVNNVVGPIINLLKDVITAAFDLLLGIIKRILELVFRIIDMIFNFIDTLLAAVKALAFAWNNTTPANLTWLPNCNLNPQQAFCIPSWIAENTLFSGIGALIIPLLVSIQVIDLILWAIFSAIDAIKGSGEVS